MKPSLIAAFSLVVLLGGCSGMDTRSSTYREASSVSPAEPEPALGPADITRSEAARAAESRRVREY
jgi:hypothetical protein